MPYSRENLCKSNASAKIDTICQPKLNHINRNYQMGTYRSGLERGQLLDLLREKAGERARDKIFMWRSAIPSDLKQAAGGGIGR